MEQGYFDFARPEGTGPDGLDTWRKRREAEIAELARNAGLPLHHLVRAELACGASLVGKLVLHEAALWVETARPKRLRLRIGDADFTWDEIVSCVRLD